MLHVTVEVETSHGPGHIAFMAKNKTAVEAMLETFKELCEDTYDWYKITSVDTKAVDDETGDVNELH